MMADTAAMAGDGQQSAGSAGGTGKTTGGAAPSDRPTSGLPAAPDHVPLPPQTATQGQCPPAPAALCVLGVPVHMPQVWAYALHPLVRSPLVLGCCVVTCQLPEPCTSSLIATSEFTGAIALLTTAYTPSHYRDDA